MMLQANPAPMLSVVVSGGLNIAVLTLAIAHERRDES